MLAGRLILALACAAGDWSWHETLSPHFAVRHQVAFMPGGFTMSLERLHSRLRLDLAMFSPWMSRERLKLYLYKDRESYLAGEFKPPPWSNGISMYHERTVAVHDQPDRRKLMDVIAHETTHILFESYWGEAGRTAPSWLNEGLAMVEEADVDERSEWFRAMADLGRKRRIPFAEFARIAPASDLHKKAEVETWYVQAYSIAYFLLRQHSRLQFKNLCASLRDGKPLDEALWLAYRYRGLAQLEKAWLHWLRDPQLRKRMERPVAISR